MKNNIQYSATVSISFIEALALSAGFLISSAIISAAKSSGSVEYWIFIPFILDFSGNSNYPSYFIPIVHRFKSLFNEEKTNCSSILLLLLDQVDNFLGQLLKQILSYLENFKLNSVPWMLIRIYLLFMLTWNDIPSKQSYSTNKTVNRSSEKYPFYQSINQWTLKFSKLWKLKWTFPSVLLCLCQKGISHSSYHSLCNISVVPWKLRNVTFPPFHLISAFHLLTLIDHLNWFLYW